MVAGEAQVVDLVEAREALCAETVGIDFKAASTHNASARVQKSIRVEYYLAVSAADLRAFSFGAARRAGTIDAARLRALYAVPVVAGVTGDAGGAGAHGWADAVGFTEFAVLEIEEVVIGADVVGGIGCECDAGECGEGE